ncbi:MAG: acetyl-CoA carboxylase biotin carboxyl carrier protein [Clostridiales bacterium]|nr:acetyl-CoA carboxylase biotin carboxyl carrier protein [Clostridiales bacterium]
MDIDKLSKLIQEFSKSNLLYLMYEEENIRIKLRNKEGTILANMGEGQLEDIPNYKDIALTKGQTTDQPSSENKDLVTSIKEQIKSPTVGTFYRSPSPDSDPYIQVGDIIEKGQVIGIVEAMKVMNEIESPYKAKVKEILVKDEEMVEFGQTLVVLEAL